MTVGGITDYLKQHWPAIREQLLSGTYEPKPVRRVEIPKPDGGVRKLGIPTVLDRLIQQAVMQVLQRRWDSTFSDHSYGFRPGRSAHQAVAEAQQYIAEGYGWVVDLDLEKFFDRVNHDKLMGQVAKRVEDKRLLKLTRALLNAGVMENGLVSPSVEGTPQGGPLSPVWPGCRRKCARKPRALPTGKNWRAANTNWSANAGPLKPAWPRSGRSMKRRRKDSTDHLRIGITGRGTVAGPRADGAEPQSRLLTLQKGRGRESRA